MFLFLKWLSNEVNFSLVIPLQKVQSLPPAVTSLEFDNFQIIGFSIRSRSEITILDYCDPPPNISNPVKRRLKR